MTMTFHQRSERRALSKRRSFPLISRTPRITPQITDSPRTSPQSSRKFSLPTTLMATNDTQSVNETPSIHKPWLQFLDDSTLNLIEESVYAEMESPKKRDSQTQDDGVEKVPFTPRLKNSGSSSALSSLSVPGKGLVPLDETCSSTEDLSESTISTISTLSPPLTDQQLTSWTHKNKHLLPTTDVVGIPPITEKRKKKKLVRILKKRIPNMTKRSKTSPNTKKSHQTSPARCYVSRLHRPKSFNAEPPINAFKKTPRFITPHDLHFTRNHGASPNLSWKHHTLQLGGMLSMPMVLHMDELPTLASPRQITVTIVSSGNRRSEQSLIDKTNGLDWGGGAVATSVYKGVLVRDILSHAGVSESDLAGKHVEFLGIEDLPNPYQSTFKEDHWGKRVQYGTSIPLSRVMNPAFDIMIAYEQNGQSLHPDRGFPIRLIVPGYAASRNIKWLKQINILPHETKNPFYYHESRLLPSNIKSMGRALKSDWFYRSTYIYNETNINSVIISPAHNTKIVVDKLDKMYSVNGYAYSGGGRAVTGVDVSLDGGATWEQATVSRKGQPTEYDMHWSWVIWTLKVKASDLILAKEIRSRAWDSSNNRQPSEPSWNLMGCGCNHQYQVTVETAKNKKDSLAFTFVHPSPPKTVDVASGLSILEDTKPSVNPESDISFSSITTTAATSDMSMESFVHSTDVWLKEVDPNHEFTSNQYAPPDQALNQRSAVPFRLRRKSVLSENVLVLEFALPTADHVLGLPTGKHVYISAMIGETKVERRYTPISSDYEAGTVKLLVQVYRPNPLFPYGGQMSQYLDQLKIGSHLDFQGPVGEFEYCSNGRLIMEGSHRIAGRLNMIASGVGITSFLHIIEKILGNKSDTTRLTLVYLAKDESELLMRSTLDKWANAQSFKFRVQYVLAERWPRGWEYSTGYARKSLFARHLFPPGNDVYNLMSCPPELSERCFPFLATLGHACDKLYSF